MRLVALLALLLSTSAYASLVTVSASGVFTNSAPTNLLSAPDAPWSVTLSLDIQPAGVVGGTAFEVAHYYNFAYALNGAPVYLNPALIYVDFGEAAYYYFNINFGDLGYGDLGIDIATPFYSGTSLSPYDCGCYSPTLLPGSYPTPTHIDALFSGIDGNGHLIYIDAGPTTLTISTPTPEPSWLPLLAACALALWLKRGLLKPDSLISDSGSQDIRP